MNQRLTLELLELTRMYAYIPYNAIFSFVALDENRTLDFFNKYIYDVMSAKRAFGDDYKVMGLLDEIRITLQDVHLNAIGEA